MAVAFITGTSSGIGLATALRLASGGYEVYAGVRNPKTATALKQAIEKSGLQISIIQIDVMDEASIKHAVAKILSDKGQIDVLVNNAGIARGNSIEESDMAQIREMFETNFFGAVALMQAVLPGMRQRKSGTIINVTSIAGRFVSAGGGFYAASKFALEAVSESLALQVKRFNIRVAMIEPGVIATSIFENARNAQEAPNLQSPYAADGRRGMAFFMKQLTKPDVSQPDLVAETIETAIKTDNPKLRYLVGEDAKALWNGRQSVSDEEFLELSVLEDDEEYFDALERVYGQDLFRS
jgi:NADP-dependent 3-hydroxy acid dehydrogenase YdfG